MTLTETEEKKTPTTHRFVPPSPLYENRLFDSLLLHCLVGAMHFFAADPARPLLRILECR